MIGPPARYDDLPGPNGRVGNGLLDALPGPEREKLTARMQRARHNAGDVLFEVAQPIRRVWFPISGVMSLITVAAEGAAVEVATVGNEGMMGLPVFLSTGSFGNMRGVVKLPGESLAIEKQDFEDECRPAGPLHSAMEAYAHALFTQASQEAACNRLHSVLQRTGRWLLMTHDRVGTDRFRLTQEFLAGMLGVRRASVTEAAGALQRAGAIGYRRGDLTIVDRAALERAACECYAIVRAEYERVLPQALP